MPTPEQHAVLSASSAKRWLNCPGSVRLSQGISDTDTKYTRAGTVAHAICEAKARAYFEVVPKRTLNAQLKKLRADPDYNTGMEGSSDQYLDTLKELALGFTSQPFVALETRVDYSDYAPGGFGTADCLMIGEGQMVIVDYKNGTGEPVDAENNPQMQLYALGALQTYGLIYGDSIHAFKLVIVQPNSGGVKTWTTTRGELLKWGVTVVMPNAALALSDNAECHPGAWCKSAFCPVKATCSARARQMLSLENDMKAGTGIVSAPANAPAEPGTAPILSDEEVGNILARAQDLAAWVTALEDYALKAILDGRTIPGFKAVEGRGSYEWVGGTDAAFTTLQERGVPEAVLYERKPVSVAGLKKTLGKKAFDESTVGLVQRLPGKPALKPESDPRPCFNAAEQAFGVVDDGD